MKILIGGGAGEIGKYLIKYFSRRGHEVAVLGPAPKPLEMAKLPIAYFRGNLVDQALVNKIVQGMNSD